VSLPGGQRRSSERRALRMTRYEEVLRRHEAGQSVRAIGRAMNLDRRTVRGFVRAGAFPERAQRRAGASLLDPYRPYMATRAAEGCRNATQIWHELRARGFTGGHSIVRTAFAQLRGEQPDRPGSTGSPDRSWFHDYAVPAPSTRRACTWVLNWKGKKHEASEHADNDPSKRERFVEALCRIAPAVDTARHLAHQFFNLMRHRDLEGFDRWLAQTRVCEVIELRRFAAGLEADLSAVRAAFHSHWSSGQVEGQINRLKYLKRQMYGRAKLDLLRIRVLHPN